MLNLNSEAFLQYKTDGAALEAAIRTAKESGENTLTVPRFNARTGKTEWRIEKAIRIPSHFTLILDNCTMVMETGSYENMFVNEHFDCPATLETTDEDIEIRGEGFVTIHGGIHNRLYTSTAGKYGMPLILRNCFMYFYNAKNIRLSNLHFEESRWVGVAFYLTTGATLKNIDFDAVPKVPMEGGVTLFRGCSGFTFENLTGRTGGDYLAIRANQDFTPKEGVPEGHADVHDLKIRNLTTNNPLTCMFRLWCGDGAKVYNIDMDTVMDSSDYFEKNRPWAILGLGGPGMKFRKSAPALGDVYNISARNVTSRASQGIGINVPLKDCTFTNVQTFGDSISGVKSVVPKTAVENVRIDHLFFGAGSEPNCSNQFIGKMATGVQPTDFTNIDGEIVLTDVRPADGEA